MSNNGKDAMTKKQQDDLASAFNNLPWGLPLGFPSMSPFGAFPPLGLTAPNFPSLNSFTAPGSTAFPPPLPPLLSNDPTNTHDLWANGLSAGNSALDYNEYAKQLGFLMNAFTEQQQTPDSEKAKGSSSSKQSKTKRSNTPSSGSSDIPNGKNSSKTSDDVRRSSSTHSSSTNKSTSSSSKTKTPSNPSPQLSTTTTNQTSKNSTSTDPSMLDPLAFAAAAAAAAASGGLTFPYFLPSLLSQTSSSPSASSNSGANNAPNFPFPGLSNPAGGLYPFLSPDWFTSAASLPTLNQDTKQSKKRSKSIRTLTEEQEKTSSTSNSSLLHSALTDSNGLRLSRQSSTTETPMMPSNDESKSNDDDDSDPNPKRKKTDEVNETLVRIPLNLGWKRVTIVRAITRTGVRGDVCYYAPCGRKLRSFQEIDRYLAKKNVNSLDRSNFTFSSKVHIGFFHEPKEGPDGKTIFQESTEDEIVNRILEINPKFRRIEGSSSPSMTPTNGSVDHSNSTMFDDNRKHRSEQEEMAKRAAEIKSMRLMRNLPNESPKTNDPFVNPAFQHTDFLKAIIEQQKLVQQQEFEHKQKLQQEQQEQERKRQEIAYLKQLEMKKRQEEKLLILEQRKAEKNAERERKIQEKYIEIVTNREMKRITEDLQLRDLKPLPTLKPIENLRMSSEGFANSLLIIEFVNNFKKILEIPENLVPTLHSFHQTFSNSSSRDLNSLCQILLRIALDDPGIPNPKKALTNLGQKLSEIDITEHTFSEILRIYIRERNGFDDRLTQSLSDASFQSLIVDEKAEVLAFLCNDLSNNKRVVEEIDRNLEELTGLKHEKFELEKRLRRLKFEKINSSNSNNVKKIASLLREKDVNSSDNESPDESDNESMKIEEDSTMNNDPATSTADDQDIETLDETKIDDLDKRLALVSRKYTLIKRRVIDKQCYTRALHLGQDRYRRQYWYFSHLPGVYVEGSISGDVPAEEIQNLVENVTKQKLDRKPLTTNNETNNLSRSAQRRKHQHQQQPKPVPTVVMTTDVNKPLSEQSDNDDEQQQTKSSNNNVNEDLATMDLSAFCMAVHRDEEANITTEKPVNTNGNHETTEIKIENNNESTIKREHEEVVDDNLPLDLSCSKPKRSCQEEKRVNTTTIKTTTPKTTPITTPVIGSRPPSLPVNPDNFPELNDLATAAMLVNSIKQEPVGFSKNFMDFQIGQFQNAFIPPSMTEESSLINLRKIEKSIRDKFQYEDPLPMDEDVQNGWWLIQSGEELRQLMKCLAKRGQRERYLCRMLQRYFDVINHSMKTHQQSMLNVKNDGSSPSAVENDENETNGDDHQHSSSFNEMNSNEQMSFDGTQEMDVLNEIYNLADRIIASSLQCRSFDGRKRLTFAEIQSKGSDVLDEAKNFLSELERNIERRYLKHPFVRRYEINLSSLNRINQHGTYHHTMENSSNEIVSSSKYDEVPQQLERWRRTVHESRTTAQLALCLTQLERCIAWEKSIMRVYCEICNSDVDEEKLLLCDGCDHGTHTYCFAPPMSFIPPNDWYCYVCIGKAKGENLCFVCGNKGETTLNRCESCGKLFHEECLKNAKHQRGKWLCVLCASNDNSALMSNFNSSNNNNKWQVGRQTSRSTNTSANATNNSPSASKTRQPSICSSNGGETTNSRSRSNTNRKSKSRPTSNHTDSTILQETHSNSSHADTTTVSSSIQSPVNGVDLDDDVPSPTVGGNATNGKKKNSRKSKNHANENEDLKACRVLLNELLKNEAAWPFQTPVDVKQHPEYYECIKNPMDLSTMKKKMRNHQYHKREEFFHDVELILDNCRYYNEDDSPVGEAGHALRTFFEERWAQQFG